jgi:hypothetical protein
MFGHMWRAQRILIAAIAGATGAGSVATSASADVATFQMRNIHWHNTTYIGNVSTPLIADWYGSGSFTWTYTPGNFANGHGALVSLQIPPWGVGPGGYATTTTVDSNGISTTINANVDSFSYDIALSFSPALTSPTQTVNITSGSYQFSPGTYHFISGEFDGTIIGGAVSVCPPDFNGSGAVNVQDIFDFLAAWFAASPSADFNGQNGLTVQDIFDFLAAWFVGC